MSHREIWWIGQQCPGIKGWDCGPDNPEKVEGPSWEGEWVADPSWAVPAIVTQGRGGWKQWCLLLGLSTYFLVAAAFSALQRQELLLLFCRCTGRGAVGAELAECDFICAWCHPCLLGCMWDRGKQRITLGKCLIWDQLCSVQAWHLKQWQQIDTI